MEKKNFWWLMLICGLVLFYGLLTLFIFLSRGKAGKLIKRKIAVGTMLLSLSSLFSGVVHAQSTGQDPNAYIPQPTTERFLRAAEVTGATISPTGIPTPVYGTLGPTATILPTVLYAIPTPTRTNVYTATVYGILPTPTAQLLGDVNGDGKVNIVDALMVAQYVVGLSPLGFNPGRADVDGSGTITIVDALMIAQKSVGLIDKFPAEG